MHTPKVQIFLLTHNRSNYVLKAAHSILAQDYDNFELVVSDNSTEETTRQLFQTFRHANMRYIKREPNIPTSQHFYKIHCEASADYFILFHDDDLMKPGFLSTVMATFHENITLMAVATNAITMIDERPTGTPILVEDDRATVVMRSPDILAERYLNFQPVPPFSSYVYNRRGLDDLMPVYAHGGKYSDVGFLMDILQRGSIVWLMKPLMYYRRHPGQDSQTPVLVDRLSLLRYIYSHTRITRRSEAAMHYRRVAWCDWLKYSCRVALRRHPKRYLKMFWMMLPYLVSNKLKSIRKAFSSST